MASQPPNVIPLIVVTVLAVLVYGLARLTWPFRACRRCHGTGRITALRQGKFRPCPRCKATGYAPRIGRRH